MKALLVLLIALSPFTAMAEQFRSGKKQVQLIELFTSEGCSSCPRADAFLSTLKEDEDLWTRRIPLAFHVDYWNSPSWRDPWASAAHTQRQSQHQQLKRISQAYTPQFVIAGQEWRGYFTRSKMPRPERHKVGSLTLTIEDQQYHVEFDSQDKRANDYVLNIAYIGMDITHQVFGGENRGATLHHDFVVLDMLVDQNQGQSWSGTMPRRTSQADAVVAWVSRAGDIAAVQAVGGELSSQE